MYMKLLGLLVGNFKLSFYLVNVECDSGCAEYAWSKTLLILDDYNVSIPFFLCAESRTQVLCSLTYTTCTGGKIKTDICVPLSVIINHHFPIFLVLKQFSERKQNLGPLYWMCRARWIGTKVVSIDWSYF